MDVYPLALAAIRIHRFLIDYDFINQLVKYYTQRKRNTDRPFYEQAEDFIETNPLGCLEVQTKISLYAAMLSGYYLETMATKLYREQKAGLSDVLDIIDFRQLYGKICELLGNEEEMKHIDRLFRQNFLLVTPMSCYLQGMTNGLLYDLISRDWESSKLIFQLLLDERK